MTTFNDPLVWVVNSIESDARPHISIKGNEIDCAADEDLHMLFAFLLHSETRQEVTKIRDTLSEYLDRTRETLELAGF